MQEFVRTITPTFFFRVETKGHFRGLYMIADAIDVKNYKRIATFRPVPFYNDSSPPFFGQQ